MERRPARPSDPTLTPASSTAATRTRSWSRPGHGRPRGHQRDASKQQRQCEHQRLRRAARGGGPGRRKSPRPRRPSLEAAEAARAGAFAQARVGCDKHSDTVADDRFDLALMAASDRRGSARGGMARQGAQRRPGAPRAASAPRMPIEGTARRRRPRRCPSRISPWGGASARRACARCPPFPPRPWRRSVASNSCDLAK